MIVGLPMQMQHFPQRARVSPSRNTQPGKPSVAQYWTTVTALVVFSIVMGYTAGIQPTSQWRFFSWHPFLMTCGMVGFAGIGAVTKKLGGYENTKVRERLLYNTSQPASQPAARESIVCPVAHAF
jgi:hypothetical protein